MSLVDQDLLECGFEPAAGGADFAYLSPVDPGRQHCRASDAVLRITTLSGGQVDKPSASHTHAWTPRCALHSDLQSTRPMGDPRTKVDVTCYSGHKGDERPIRLRLP